MEEAPGEVPPEAKAAVLHVPKFAVGERVYVKRSNGEEGIAFVESFDATELEALSAVSRSAAVDAIAGDIADAVDDAGAAPPPREGCSPSGCVRGSTR